MQMSDLRLRLGLEALPGAALMQRGGLRKSRRQQGLAAPGSDEEEGGEGSEPIDVAAAAAVAAEAAEAVLAAEVVIREFRALTRKKDPEVCGRDGMSVIMLLCRRVMSWCSGMSHERGSRGWQHLAVMRERRGGQ